MNEEKKVDALLGVVGNAQRFARGPSRPLEVGLAVRAAEEPIDAHDVLRQLVGREASAQRVDDLGIVALIDALEATVPISRLQAGSLAMALTYVLGGVIVVAQGAQSFRSPSIIE